MGAVAIDWDRAIEERVAALRGDGPAEAVAEAWAHRYGVSPALVMPLVVPWEERDLEEAPIYARASKGDGYAAKSRRGRRTLTGTSLRRPSEALSWDLLGQLELRADRAEVLRHLRWWTAALAVRAWLEGRAPADTYPRRGYRRDSVGYWYGPTDVATVRNVALDLGYADLAEVYKILVELCHLYRRLHPKHSRCACERQLEWSHGWIFRRMG